MAHLDDLALTAHIDGDADHGAHLSGCEPCRARLDELRSVVDAIGQAPPPPAPDEADRMIAAALGASDDGGAGEPASAAIVSLDERRARRTRVLAVAAVVLLALAAVPLILAGRGDGGSDMAAQSALTEDHDGAQERGHTAAGPGPAADSSAELFAGAGGGATGSGAAASAGPVSDGHLGPQAQVSDLERIARARLDGATGGDDTGPPVVARCEDSARDGLGARGALVYVATVEWRGTDAEVLVFREDDGARPLAVMARPGCRLLDRGRT